ncbi:MAG: pirin family protein, partial [Candidatus Hodarchaeota archaeon]
MTQNRKILHILKSRPTIEGAGVRLKRAFAEPTLLDPFLLLDDFHSDNPNDYIAGFP